MDADAFARQKFDKMKRDAKKENIRKVSELMKNKGDAETVFNKCISLHQSQNQKNGTYLEHIIENLLRVYEIPFLRQVSDADGIIIPPGPRMGTHDIILDAKFGDAIKDKIIISCKASIRERYKQDRHLGAKKVYLVSFEHKHTLPSRFGIEVVTIGNNGALKKLLEGLAVELLSKDTSVSCSQPSSDVGAQAHHPMTTAPDQTPVA